MTIHALPGFLQLNTHHCVTGSMRHVYQFNHHDISEDMLLGLGEGVSFIYWQQKGTMPFLGGRGTPKPSFEELAAQRTGVQLIPHTTSSTRKARETLLTMLANGMPVMLQVDMGFLPYLNFDGQEYHFGGHLVVACGYDAASETVLIADRDGLYPVPLPDLEKARSSTYKPFPPKNKWYTFDFSAQRSPSPSEMNQAISSMCQLMLNPPISNIGVKGIRKAAQSIMKWPQTLNPDELKWALFNGYIFISPVGGTGGGIFRIMFSRFLCEAAARLQNSRIADSAHQFHEIGMAWEAVGEQFRQLSQQPSPILDDIMTALLTIADQEEAAWKTLSTCIN